MKILVVIIMSLFVTAAHADQYKIAKKSVLALCPYKIPCQEYYGSLIEGITNKRMQEYGDQDRVFSLLIQRGFSRNQILDELIDDYDKERERLFGGKKADEDEDIDISDFKTRNDADPKTRYLVCCDNLGHYYAKKSDKIKTFAGQISADGEVWINSRYCFTTEKAPREDPDMLWCLVSLEFKGFKPGDKGSMYSE